MPCVAVAAEGDGEGSGEGHREKHPQAVFPLALFARKVGSAEVNSVPAAKRAVVDAEWTKLCEHPWPKDATGQVLRPCGCSKQGKGTWDCSTVVEYKECGKEARKFNGALFWPRGRTVFGKAFGVTSRP